MNWFALITLLLCGCVGRSAGPAGPAKPYSPPPIVNSHGRTLHDVQGLSVLLHSGLASTEVWHLLGPPDETSLYVAGTETPRSWECLAWTYRWKVDDIHTRRLEIHFQAEKQPYLINDWQWLDY